MGPVIPQSPFVFWVAYDVAHLEGTSLAQLMRNLEPHSTLRIWTETTVSLMIECASLFYLWASKLGQAIYFESQPTCLLTQYLGKKIDNEITTQELISH